MGRGKPSRNREWKTKKQRNLGQDNCQRAKSGDQSSQEDCEFEIFVIKVTAQRQQHTRTDFHCLSDEVFEFWHHVTAIVMEKRGMTQMLLSHYNTRTIIVTGTVG